MKLLALWLLCFSSLCLAQKVKTPVVFECTCDDGGGLLYATKFRDALATSPRYTEVSKTKNGATEDGRYYWTVSVVTIDGDGENNRGLSSAVSAAIFVGNTIFDGNYVQVCGRDVVTACAQKLLAILDKEVSENP